MSATLRNVLAGCISILALGAFLIIHGMAAWMVITQSPLPGYLGGQKAIYFATALTGLVSGIVAAAFGVPAPKPPINTNVPPAAHVVVRVQRLALLTGFANTRVPWVGSIDGRAVIATCYGILYFIGGAMAVIAWLTVPEGGQTVLPVYTESLALVTIGVCLAIANSFLVPSPAP